MSDLYLAFCSCLFRCKTAIQVHPGHKTATKTAGRVAGRCQNLAQQGGRQGCRGRGPHLTAHAGNEHMHAKQCWEKPGQSTYKVCAQRKFRVCMTPLAENAQDMCLNAAAVCPSMYDQVLPEVSKRASKRVGERAASKEASQGVRERVGE